MLLSQISTGRCPPTHSVEPSVKLPDHRSNTLHAHQQMMCLLIMQQKTSLCNRVTTLCESDGVRFIPLQKYNGFYTSMTKVWRRYDEGMTKVWRSSTAQKRNRSSSTAHNVLVTHLCQFHFAAQNQWFSHMYDEGMTKVWRKYNEDDTEVTQT